jgi:hypothetical protein
VRKNLREAMNAAWKFPLRVQFITRTFALFRVRVQDLRFSVQVSGLRVEG